MTKLSLNKAAKEAGVAKSTLLERLNHNDPELKLSAEKNGKGHWQIDPAELFRVFPKSSSTEREELQPTTLENDSKTSGLQVEVKMLREQMAKVEELNDRERQSLVDQIEELKAEAERRSREHMQALALLTDQRDREAQPEKKGFLGRVAAVFTG